MIRLNLPQFFGINFKQERCLAKFVRRCGIHRDTKEARDKSR